MPLLRKLILKKHAELHCRLLVPLRCRIIPDQAAQRVKRNRRTAALGLDNRVLARPSFIHCMEFGSSRVGLTRVQPVGHGLRARGRGEPSPRHPRPGTLSLDPDLMWAAAASAAGACQISYEMELCSV
jgi:hypothetical protein